MKSAEIVERSKKNPPQGQVKTLRREGESLQILEHAGSLIVKGWILFETETED